MIDRSSLILILVPGKECPGAGVRKYMVKNLSMLNGSIGPKVVC